MSMTGGNAAQWAAQGQQAMQAGMYEQAAQAFYQAIQLAPNVDGLYYHYASACLWRGYVQDAMGALERCMALRGNWYNHAVQMQMQIRSQMQMQQSMPGMGMPGQMGQMGGQMGQMGGMPGQMPMGQMGGMPMPGQMPQLGAMPMPGQMPMAQMGGQMGMAGALGGQMPSGALGHAPQGGGIQALVGGQPQQAAAAPEPKKEEKKKKSGVGWGLAAIGIIGAAALGGAIGTGALDGVTKKVLG